MAANRLDQLIEEWAPRLKKAFLEAFAAIRDRILVGFIVERLEKGDIDGALKGVGIDPVAFRGFDGAIAQAFESGGNFIVDGLPSLREPDGHRLAIRFDARNLRAEMWLKTHSSRLVTDIVADQRTAIRTALTAGMEAGNAPRDVALDLVGRVSPVTGKREGGVIGLTASQEAWARNYAAELVAGDPKALTRALRDKRFDRTVTKAIKEGRPIPAEAIQKMVAAYRTRALRYRAETIGRTEAMTSLHQAQNEAMEQGIEAGQVQESAVTKKWHSAGDGRVRDTHRSLNGQQVGFRDQFASPSGARLRFPGDPSAPASETTQCRCWMETKVDFLAGIR